MTGPPKHILRLVRSSITRGLATSSEGSQLALWEAKAKKEAKGADPYEAFGSTNADVRVLSYNPDLAACDAILRSSSLPSPCRACA